MSAPATVPEVRPPQTSSRRRFRRLRRRLIVLISLLAGVGLLAWTGTLLYRSVGSLGSKPLPTTTVQLGDVRFTVNARAELRGGNSEELTAPMTGDAEVRIMYLRRPGELVKPGDTVVQFDTTEHSYKLKEAEADLAEAEQQVAKAEAEAQATEEENSYSLLKARSDVVQAELECRKNRIVSTIAARQNDLALQNARDHLAQLEKDLASRKETSRAGIAIQEALRNKSRMQAETARRNIQNMTVRAHRNGYVFVRQNPNTNFYFRGMMLPQFKTGDAVNPGMAVAQIPDLNNWELAANIAELDRGHLAPGQAAEIHIIAVPFRPFHGHIKDMGGTSGPPWDRHFECRISLDDPSPELRPGMNSRLLVTTDTMHGVLWIPAHAIFESDGRTFVYVPSGAGFAPRDVKIVRRSESQAVISGLNRGQVIALASPEQDAKQEKASRGGALGALPK